MRSPTRLLWKWSAKSHFGGYRLGGKLIQETKSAGSLWVGSHFGDLENDVFEEQVRSTAPLGGRGQRFLHQPSSELPDSQCGRQQGEDHRQEHCSAHTTDETLARKQQQPVAWMNAFLNDARSKTSPRTHSHNQKNEHTAQQSCCAPTLLVYTALLLSNPFLIGVPTVVVLSPFFF